MANPNMCIRIDANTKTRATSILHSLGLNVSQAVILYLRQIIYNNGIPFELKIPNKKTVKTFQKTNVGKELHKVANIRELAKELKS
jgi:DNA-damage-inducible protein J